MKQDSSAVQHIADYTEDNAPAPNGGDDDDDDDDYDYVYDDTVDRISNKNDNAKLYLYCALSGDACA
jgi:hypothetical protein